jgi:2-keto-4-pentenoate hydratase/2-oxohepta-3-ene-1,7-dioic acid hydratase in catechol pathway
VIIGTRGKNIPKDRALAHVFGYTVINDVTARDLQRRHEQWFKGKGIDGSCPMGPWIVHASAIKDPQALDIKLRVNGGERQNSNTKHMIFDLRTIIESLSLGMTLEPGDVIATGTPSGVGFAMNPPGLLKVGDVIEAEVEGIGMLRNTVREAPHRVEG